MSKTLIILNPHAGGGEAGKLWTQIEPALRQHLGDFTVAVTQHPDEVAPHLDQTYNLTRVISVGGDGTNHALINALADHPQSEPIIYGMLPIGTGRDWARSIGIPTDNIPQAAAWLADTKPHATDIGLLTYTVNGVIRREHFLNIASAGLGGEVDKRVNSARVRRPWTFLAATISAILNYKAQEVVIRLDGELWYEGKALLTVVANGTTFGHGMKIAPNARVDDHLFDVILVKDASKLELLKTLRRVYDGSHLMHPAVQSARARHVSIVSSTPLSLDLDGEYAVGTELNFEMQPDLLNLLR